MTLAGFLVEVRARAEHVPRPQSAENAVATLIGIGIMPGPQGAAVHRVLDALTRPEAAIDLAFRELASVGPLALGALDCLVGEMLEGRYSPGALQKAMGREAS